MRRTAFKMQLNEGCVAEYKKRHDEIWPELVEELKHSGISDYSIFFDAETHILFAVQKQAVGHEHDDKRVSAIVQKWWEMMADIMDTNPDASPVTKPLIEVFHID